MSGSARGVVEGADLGDDAVDELLQDDGGGVAADLEAVGIGHLVRAGGAGPVEWALPTERAARGQGETPGQVRPILPWAVGRLRGPLTSVAYSRRGSEGLLTTSPCLMSPVSPLSEMGTLVPCQQGEQLGKKL